MRNGKLGAGKGKRHLVCLTLGTGVGSGLIVNGELLRGATCSAGELGQTSIDYRGRLGHYGNRRLPGRLCRQPGNSCGCTHAVCQPRH